MRVRAKTDKGVAGLTILLSLVTMLFVIGLLVMIFSLMGGGLRDATYTSTDGSINNESVTLDGVSTSDLAVVNYNNVVCTTTPVQLINETVDGAVLGVTNVTLTSDCTLNNATALNDDFLGNGTVFLSYTYNYDAENTATSVINETTSSIAGVTDWFSIFLVIGAMVVLILLTVIIITAIRGSGLLAQGSA